MALIALNVGRGSVQGISVDVHVHRISDRLGWTRKAKDPEHTRAQLEHWMPREKWSELNLLCTLAAQNCPKRFPVNLDSHVLFAFVVCAQW